MADEAIVFVSRHRIRPGTLEALRSFLRAGSGALEAAKPRTVAFLAYIDAGATELMIVHVFADASGFAAHVEGADARSDAAAAFLEPLELTVFGAPDAATLAILRAGLPPDVPVTLSGDLAAGFLRRG